MRLFIFGLGYVATELVRQWQKLGFEVTGTHRELKPDEPIPHFAFSDQVLLDADGLAALENAEAVLITIPPSGMMVDPVYRFYARVLSESRHLKWLGYLSTTGVYGDHHGNWVSEETPVNPQTPRSQARVLAEQQWGKMRGMPVHIFRLSGIYGPGKSALQRAEKDAPIIHKPAHVFNRIHVADIVMALITSMFNPTPHQIYNLSDDLPAAGDEVLRFAYELIGKTPPEAVLYRDVDFSEMAKEFYSECKRVNADKIKSALGLSWQYPDYKTGLQAEHDQS